MSRVLAIDPGISKCGLLIADIKEKKVFEALAKGCFLKKVFEASAKGCLLKKKVFEALAKGCLLKKGF